MQIEIAVLIWFGLFCWMLKALAFGLGEPDHGED